jgi:5-methylcytosine-specific restriction endonuclease McrA
MDSCIILNADYTFLNIVSWQKAITLMVKGKTEVLKYTKKVVRNFERTVIMKIPAVMKLINIIRIIYRTHVPFNKRNIIVRDGFKCAYCNTESKSLTVDHIVPTSRGGKSNFENCVAACKKCNAKKGNKLPSEISMYLQRKPFQPTIAEFLRLKLKKLKIDVVLKELGVY